MTEKRCRLCSEVKPLVSYHKRGDAADGYRAECKECNRARQREYYVRTAEERRQIGRDNYAAKRADEVEARRQYRAEHGARINARRRELRALEPERHRAMQRAWRHGDPARMVAHAQRVEERRRADRSLSADDVAYIAVLRKDPCSYCGGGAGTRDHIVPLAAGGESGWENATAACRSCNASKKDRPLLVWMLGRS